MEGGGEGEIDWSGRKDERRMGMERMEDGVVSWKV